MDISTSAREARSNEDDDQGQLNTWQGRTSARKNGHFLTELVARNRLTVAIIASVVLVVLLTPIGSIAPIPTGDDSWHAARRWRLPKTFSSVLTDFHVRPIGIPGISAALLHIHIRLRRAVCHCSPSPLLCRALLVTFSLVRKGMGRSSRSRWNMGCLCCSSGNPAGCRARFSGPHLRWWTRTHLVLRTGSRRPERTRDQSHAVTVGRRHGIAGSH